MSPCRRLVWSQLLQYIPDGAAVLLQKPMGETLSDARAILEICRTKRLTAAVNFQLRFAPNMLMAWHLNESCALGKVHEMEVRVSVMTPLASLGFRIESAANRNSVPLDSLC